MNSRKELIVIGDRVLVAPLSDKDKTAGGLYLPQGMAEKEKVQSGLVVKVGPGYIVPDTETSESWMSGKSGIKYIPLQVKEGDQAVFLRREAVEIEYEGKKYLIVHQAGILALIREEILPPDTIDDVI